MTRKTLCSILPILLIIAGGCSTMTSETRVWRITDTDSGTVYAAKSFEAHFTGSSGFMSVNMENTFTLQSKAGQAHVDSNSSWEFPYSVMGQSSTMRGSGYDFAVFRDILTGQRKKLTRFSADAANAGDVPGLISK